MIEYNDTKFRCPMELGIYLVKGKWKTAILCSLDNDNLRFTELCKRFPEVTQKVLTEQLRELERDRLINRTVYPEVPPKVEYALTACGQRLLKLLNEIENWSKEFLEEKDSIKQT